MLRFGGQKSIYFIKKRVDKRRGFATFPPTMKSDMLNGILIAVFGILVVAGVILALQVVNITRETRLLQGVAQRDASLLAQTQSLYNDAAAYNQKVQSPELSRILQSLQAKPATR